MLDKTVCMAQFCGGIGVANAMIMKVKMNAIGGRCLSLKHVTCTIRMMSKEC